MSEGDNDTPIKNVKKTVLDLKKKADELIDENNKKSSELESLQSSNNEIKVEVNNMVKRVDSLEVECTVSQDSLDKTKNYIDNIGKSADENERWRKEFERKQTENDERVEEMTSLIKSAYESTESTSAKYDEARERLLKTTESIGTLSKRIDDAKKRIDEKEKEMKVKLAAYKKMQSEAEQRIEKENQREAHLARLRKQVEEAESRASKAEADLAQKQMDIEKMKRKLKNENETVTHLRKDMSKMSSEYKKL